MMYKTKSLILFSSSVYGLHMDQKRIMAQKRNYGTSTIGETNSTTTENPTSTAGEIKKSKTGRTIQGKSSVCNTAPDASKYTKDRDFDGENGNSKTGAQCYVTKTEKEPIEFNTRWVVDNAATDIIVGRPGKAVGVIQNEYDDLVEVSNVHGKAKGIRVDAITPLGLREALYLKVYLQLFTNRSNFETKARL